MNSLELKELLLDNAFQDIVSRIEMDGSILTNASRQLLTDACQDIADEKGFGKAVEVVIPLSRALKFLLADPEVDQLETSSIPVGSGTAVARLESNPNRAHRGNVKTLIEHGIITTNATEESWMYEQWPSGRKGTSQPLNENQSGWAKKQSGAIKCFLCSGLGDGREYPVNPNEIFIHCPGPLGPIYAGCNFAALAPFHMTAFRKQPTQQRVDTETLAQIMALLEQLEKGSAGQQPFTVIHNGDLTVSFAPDGKPVMSGVGATLLHDHNQFMRADLPVLHAVCSTGKTINTVHTARVVWPSSMISVDAPRAERTAFMQTANSIISLWQSRDPANTVNLIITTGPDGSYILFIALRRIGMVDAPEKSCVASLEQCGIIVLDDHSVFEKYAAAGENARRTFLETVLQFVDPLYLEAGGDTEKRNALLDTLIA